MYQNESKGRGCKVKTSTPISDWNAISSTSQARGVDSDRCSSSNIRSVLSAVQLAKSLIILHPSNRVAIRWRGATFKQCVIDATTLKVDAKHMNDQDTAQILPREGGIKCKNG